MDAALEIHLDTPILLSARVSVPPWFLGSPPHCSSCGGGTPSWGNYEKSPCEFCDRRGLFAVHCRTDGCLGDIAGRYGPVWLSSISYPRSMPLGSRGG